MISRNTRPWRSCTLRERRGSYFRKKKYIIPSVDAQPSADAGNVGARLFFKEIAETHYKVRNEGFRLDSWLRNQDFKNGPSGGAVSIPNGLKRPKFLT
jgi:hypothetical protein